MLERVENPNCWFSHAQAQLCPFRSCSFLIIYLTFLFSDTFHEHHSQVCDCPVPCELSIYDSSLSYATISNFVVRKMLTSAESQSLKGNLLTALETASKKNKYAFEEFKSLIEDVVSTFEKLNASLERVAEYLNQQATAVQGVFNDTLSAYAEKERLYRYQIYVIERNFLRGREAMEERYVRNIVLAFVEFALINVKRIRRLALIPQAKMNERKSLYNHIGDSLIIRQEIGDLAKKNLTRLRHAFIKGKKIFNYKFENISRSHNNAIVPRPLMNYSMYHNSYMVKFGPKTSRDLNRIHKALDLFLDAAKDAYINSTVNETSLNNTFEQYLFSCRTFMYSKSVFYSQGIDYPVPVLEQRRIQFDKIWDDINTIISRMKQNIEPLYTGLDEAEHILKGDIKSLVENLVDYIQSDTGSKLSLTEMMMSPSFQSNISYFGAFFNELNTRGQDIFDLWTMIKEPLGEFWTAILADEDMVEYYKFTNNSRFLQNFTEVLHGNNMQSDKIRDDFDVREAIANADSQFVYAVDGITKHVQEFNKTIKVDSTFVR